MNVVVINIVSLNPGDAAILQGTLEILQRAYGDDVSVTVFDRDGAAAARYYPWAEFRPALFQPQPTGRLAALARRYGRLHHLHRLHSLRLKAAGKLLTTGLTGLAAGISSKPEREALRRYAAADLVISSGGTYLVPHYNLLLPLLDCELALALGRPLVFFPQSLGPFDHTRLRQRLRRVFARSVRVIVRDGRSAENLRQLGVPEDRIMLAADAAFALSPAADATLPAAGSQPRLAVSVREWAHFAKGDAEVMQARYLAAVAAVTTHLVRKHGASVTFISTCQGMPEYWTDDSAIARQLAAGLDPDVAASVTVDHAFRDPLALLQELAGFDAVIATRMHAAILALCAGVPVLPIAYEFKTRELFRALQLERWVTDIDEIDPDGFVHLSDRFLGELAEVRSLVHAGVAERRGTALRLADILRRAVPA